MNLTTWHVNWCKKKKKGKENSDSVFVQFNHAHAKLYISNSDRNNSLTVKLFLAPLVSSSWPPHSVFKKIKMWWPDCSKCCKILTRQIPHCLTTKACVCCILRCRFAEVSFVVFSFMLDSRNRAGQVGAAHLCSGPAVGHVSRAVCQTGHRLPLHLSCFHGNATFDLCIFFFLFVNFQRSRWKDFFILFITVIWFIVASVFYSCWRETLHFLSPTLSATGRTFRISFLSSWWVFVFLLWVLFS